MSANTATSKTSAARTRFIAERQAEYAEQVDTLTGERDWLRARRDEAFAHFIELGPPTRKLEDWRSTNIAPLLERSFAITREATDSVFERDALPDAWHATFVDGVFSAAASRLPEDGSIRFSPLREARRADAELGAQIDAHLGRVADDKQEAFTALNTALMDDGAVIAIAANTQVESPLHLRFLSSGEQTLSQPRILVIAGPGCAATIVEEHASLGDGSSLVNSVTELVLEANAHLDWVLVEHANAASFIISNAQAKLARDAHLSAHTITLEGAITRNQAGVLLGDTGAQVDLRAIFLASGNRHVDNHTLVDHAMPHCESRELYKGLLSDAARGVFRGRVLVRPDAQKTNAFQSNPNLLLSDKSEINTRPQLEIYADDVKCSHGATIGQLDPEAIFFLRSRGVSLETARNMLARGFANEIVDALPGDAVRKWVGGLADARLASVLPQPEGRAPETRE